VGAGYPVAMPRDSELTELPGVPVSHSHADRPDAPDDVWDFQDFASWYGTGWEIAAEFLGEPVRAEFVLNPPEYVVGDELSWLDAIVRRATGRRLDTKVAMAEALSQRFSAIRAYHATSVLEPHTFLQHGLLPLDAHAHQQRAREIFLNGTYPELSSNLLEQAILVVGPDAREGRVFFEANEALLVGMCGHYLLYGSEYLTAIAASLPGGRDYRQALKGRGKPTVFICDVPLAAIRSTTFLEFAGMALEFMFEHLLTGCGCGLNKYRGAGFSIRVPLDPSCVVGHYHPVGTRDPLTGRR